MIFTEDDSIAKRDKPHKLMYWYLAYVRRNLYRGDVIEKLYYDKYGKYFEKAIEMFGNRPLFDERAFAYSLCLGEEMKFPAQMCNEKRWEIYERAYMICLNFIKEEDSAYYEILAKKNETDKQKTIIEITKSLIPIKKAGGMKNFLANRENRIKIRNNSDFGHHLGWWFSKTWVKYFNDNENYVGFNFDDKVSIYSYPEIILGLRNFFKEDFQG